MLAVSTNTLPSVIMERGIECLLFDIALISKGNEMIDSATPKGEMVAGENQRKHNRKMNELMKERPDLFGRR